MFLPCRHGDRSKALRERAICGTIYFIPIATDVNRIIIYNNFLLQAQIRQQGEYESLHRDMIVGFGKWEFDPMDITNPFLKRKEVSVHIWQGDDDRLVNVHLQHYIAQKLPWIQYHELPGAGHIFPLADVMFNTILKTQLLGN